MASPFSSDIAKPGNTESFVKQVDRAFAMPIPAYSDMGKAANDVSVPLAVVGRCRQATLTFCACSSSTRTSTTPAKVREYHVL